MEQSYNNSMKTIKTIKSKLVGLTITDVTIDKRFNGELQNITLTLSDGNTISIKSKLIDFVGNVLRVTSAK